MKNSALARRQQRNHARYRGRNDLNIVPMLDIMTILTFFLIFSAVFSKTGWTRSRRWSSSSTR